jgi:hypothetical protein
MAVFRVRLTRVVGHQVSGTAVRGLLHAARSACNPKTDVALEYAILQDNGNRTDILRTEVRTFCPKRMRALPSA